MKEVATSEADRQNIIIIMTKKNNVFEYILKTENQGMIKGNLICLYFSSELKGHRKVLI